MKKFIQYLLIPAAVVMFSIPATAQHMEGHQQNKNMPHMQKGMHQMGQHMNHKEQMQGIKKQVDVLVEKSNAMMKDMDMSGGMTPKMSLQHTMWAMVKNLKGMIVQMDGMNSGNKKMSDEQMMTDMKSMHENMSAMIEKMNQMMETINKMPDKN